MTYFGRYDRYSRPSPAARQAKAKAKRAQLLKAGRAPEPVTIVGRAIAHSVWGLAWCDNLEAYSDYASRLPRGRTYARQGAVIDLQITGGHIEAQSRQLQRRWISLGEGKSPVWGWVTTAITPSARRPSSRSTKEPTWPLAAARMAAQRSSGSGSMSTRTV